MGDKTAIEWTDATWNPVTGCTKVSAGCKNCYAERVFPRAYAGQMVYLDGAPVTADDLRDALARPRTFTDVICHEDRLEQPLHWKKPRRIFVNSMSDLFHEDVPDEFISRIFAVMHLAPDHTFQILTKRPERMLQYLNEMSTNPDAYCYAWAREEFDDTALEEWPLPNVWLGVSVEDQKTADERIPLLLQTPTALRFVSYEPALAPVDFTCIKLPNGYMNALDGRIEGTDSCINGLDWIIGGSESGAKARDYETEWCANVARQCELAGVAFFMKQLTVKGNKIPFEEWPGYLQVREYPQ